MARPDTFQRNPDELSDDRGHDANNPGLERDRSRPADKPGDEQRSRHADVGDAPEQSGDGAEPQDTGKDPPATYEPDKRPSQRETI